MRSEELDGVNWIYTYYQGIKDGTYIVGKYIRQIYERLVDGIYRKDYFFDAQKANSAIEWIETHCFHTEGSLAPSPFLLEVWQKAIVSAIFGIVDENGKRVWREILLIVGRKNGKSLFGASLAKLMFYQSGYGARVFCIAPKLDQADIIYNNVWQMITLDPEWQRLKNKVEESKDVHKKKHVDDSMLARHRMTDLCIPATNSTVKKIAFSAKKSDGFNPSLTICDEIASWQGDAGLKQYEVMKSAMGARDAGDNPSIIFSCSTAGYINDGIYDELFKRATAVLNGSSQEKRLLPFIYQIDDVAKWDDINELHKSNPNLNVSVTVDYLLEEIAIARGSLSKKAEMLCKYCNVKQNASSAWFEFEDIEACMSEEITLDSLRRSYAVGGVDLSQTVDLTSAVIVVEKDGILHVVNHMWMPTNRLDKGTEEDGVPYRIMMERGFLSLSGENYVEYQDVLNWFCMLVEKYEILPLYVGYDRYSARYFVDDMVKRRFKMDDVRQGSNLTPVIRELDGLVKDRKIRFGNNSLLQSHLLNSALKTDEEAQKVRLVKVGKTTRIDGMASLLDAICVRQAHYAEIGERLKNKR